MVIDYKTVKVQQLKCDVCGKICRIRSGFMRNFNLHDIIRPAVGTLTCAVCSRVCLVTFWAKISRYSPKSYVLIAVLGSEFATTMYVCHEAGFESHYGLFVRKVTPRYYRSDGIALIAATSESHTK